MKYNELLKCPARCNFFAGHFVQFPLAGHFVRREFTPSPDSPLRGFNILWVAHNIPTDLKKNAAQIVITRTTSKVRIYRFLVGPEMFKLSLRIMHFLKFHRNNSHRASFAFSSFLSSIPSHIHSHWSPQTAQRFHYELLFFVIPYRYTVQLQSNGLR